MPNKIILKKSSVASKAPVAGDLDFGELAINYTDSKLYFKKADGSIDAFTSAAASAPVTSVGGNVGAITDAQLLASVKNVDGAGSGLDADFLDGLHASSFYLASNPNGYTSNTGTVTSVGATTPLVSSGGNTPSISIPAATASANGYMSSAYAAKLDGIAAGATNVTNTNQLTNGAGYITSAALASYLPLSGGTLSGGITLNTGGDITLQAASGSNDPGDLVWRNGAGSEMHRLWDGGTGLTYRNNAGTGYLLIHAGNYTSYAMPTGSSATNSVDVRAPIFYDSNDTGYYIDPSSYSRIRQLTLTQARVNSSKYPVGHYAPGEEVFAIDPTWTQDQIREYFNSNNVSWVADSTAPGGYAIQLTGAINVGGVYGSGFPYIPVETDDTFYMEVYIKNVTGSNTHYMGSMDFNHNFANLGGNPGSFGYWVMSNSNPGTGWTKYSGYISGFGTATGQFVSGTEYWTPQALFNYSGGGTSYISGWKVLKLTKGIVGRFPNSTVNTGEAWYGRANDRNRGTYTIQLGGGSSSGRQFEVVDYAWTNVMFSVNSDNYASASGSFRAPIFYDSNDTGYYIDPNSTSDSAQRMRGGTLYGPNTSWGASLYVGGNGRVGTSATVAVTNGNLHLDAQDGYDIYLNNYNGRWTRSPGFYDNNNSGYYLDMDSTSRLYIANVNYIYRPSHSTGYLVGSYNNIGANSAHTNPIYTIGSNYMPSDSDLGNMYGIGYSHPNAAYGNINGVLTGWGMYVCGSGTARIGLSGYDGIGIASSSWRSPIFYDSNDTGYYADPNSTSRFNYVVPNRIKLVNNVNNEPRWDFTAYVVEAQHWYGNNSSMSMYMGEGNPIWTYNLRSNIYYDRDNTGYYADLNSTTYLYYLQSATTVRSDSDRRLKENITPITSALSLVRQLQGCRYTRNDLADKTKVYIGMIAQDVLPIVPEVVSGSEAGKYSLGYAELVPVLNEAVKELDAIVTKQAAIIAKLEERLSKLLDD